MSQTYSGWSEEWEKNIYSQGRHLNLYPYHAVVRFLLSKYPDRKDREKVKVVEVGCGAGNNLWFAAREGFSVYGIEGSASAVKFANDRFRLEGLSGNIVQGDFCELPWEANTFDVLIDKGALECTRKTSLVKALDEWKRVARTGARFISVMHSTQHPHMRKGQDLGNNDFHYGPDTGYFQNLGDVHFTDKEEIREIFGSRFQITSAVLTKEFDGFTDECTNAFYIIEGINS